MAKRIEPDKLVLTNALASPSFRRRVHAGWARQSAVNVAMTIVFSVPFDAGMGAIVKQRGGVGVDSGSEMGALSFT